jgi:hypothetical protein
VTRRFPITSLFFLVSLSNVTAFAQAAPAAAPAAAAPATPAPAQAGEDTGALHDELEMQRADIDEQDQRIAELERKLKELGKAREEDAKAREADTKAGPKAAPVAELDDRILGPGEGTSWLDGSHISVHAYLQSQYEHHDDSQDQISSDGTLLNQDRFSIRRARLQLRGDWQFAGFYAELDANTWRGPVAGIQRAEATLMYRGDRGYDKAPMVGATLGLFLTPYGQEVTTSAQRRVFVERSLASRAFFPAEQDLGAMVHGQVGFLRYAAAVMNGQPIGLRDGFALQDPNADKDYVGRIGVEVDLFKTHHLSGGFSVLNGRGFHAGAQATKNDLSWLDSNENGTIDNGELVTTPGVSAESSFSFSRWATNAELTYTWEDGFGKGWFAGEFNLAQNMDRDLFVADPIANGGQDIRELGYYLAVLHDVTRYGFVGFRYDYYDPNSDFLDHRQGKLVPASMDVITLSPIVGLQFPNRMRLGFQYDFVRDHLARKSDGTPTDRSNDGWTLRFQGEI